VERPPPGFVILALLLVALLLYAGSWLRGASARRRLRRAQARGLAGEARAERILTAKGYRVVGRQVRSRYDLTVDGDELSIDVRADYVVDYEGSRYVAEVKTGKFAPRIDTAATRRQLLEYRVAFDADGVLLVDADTGKISSIDFPLPIARRAQRSSAWMIIAAIVGAAAAIGAERWFEIR
jgi:Holliday junction resolvase-like predicted endonuclease